MAHHRPELPKPPFDYEAAYAELSDHMRTLHISRISEMPRIELYLDQLLSLVEMELSFMYSPGEKVVTGAMVNNYVKQGLLPAPVRKRYTRNHLASLLFICAFKRVLSIAQVAQLRGMCTRAAVTVEDIYDAFVEQFEQAIASHFATTPDERPSIPEVSLPLVSNDGSPIGGELAHLFESSITLLASKVYLEHVLILETQRVDALPSDGRLIE